MLFFREFREKKSENTYLWVDYLLLFTYKNYLSDKIEEMRKYACHNAAFLSSNVG